MLKTTLIAAVAAGWLGAADLGREPDGVVYSPHPAFRIPLDLTPQEREQVAAVRLFVSEDEGKSWVLHSDGAPDMKIITFRASKDGSYWFSIALVDRQGNQLPGDIRAVDPGLKVVVDTTKPRLMLKPIKSRSGKSGVRWEIGDENLVPDSLRLAIWESDVTGWLPVEARHPEKPMAWFAEGTAVRKVQAMIVDRAGNTAIEEVTVEGDRFARTQPAAFALASAAGMAKSSAPAAGPSENPDVQPTRPVDSDARIGATEHTVGSSPAGTVAPPAANTASPAPVAEPGATIPVPATAPTQGTNVPPRMSVCRSNQVVVNYEVDRLGPRGDSRVELWGTKDRGMTWTRLAVDDDRQSPVEAKLDQEGAWGLLIAVAGAEGYRPPQPDTEPEVYIEVDTVAPFVEVPPPLVQKDQAIIKWNAIDKNLAMAPIDVLWSTSPEGPWNVVATELDNNGEFIWNFGRAGITGAVYFRVEAIDLAGNVGGGMTPRKTALGAGGSSEAPAATLDLAPPPPPAPRGRVLGVSPQ